LFSGEFGKSVKSRQVVEYWGIEPVAEAASAAQGKLDRVLKGNIERDNLCLPEEYFDCLVCNDVLEHLVDPWAVLRSLRRTLRPHGYVAASIPNMRYFEVIRDLLQKADWRYVDAGTLDRTHLRFFTKISMTAMFQECGYEVLRIEGINSKKLSWKFAFLNTMLRGAWNDIQYLQFACLARKQN
jgi:2-polyprenyl-3-methyl-5-hydroxy-6-metoxy-1,4-benzoquinol methylase